MFEVFRGQRVHRLYNEAEGTLNQREHEHQRDQVAVAPEYESIEHDPQHLLHTANGAEHVNDVVGVRGALEDHDTCDRIHAAVVLLQVDRRAEQHHGGQKTESVERDCTAKVVVVRLAREDYIEGGSHGLLLFRRSKRSKGARRSVID